MILPDLFKLSSDSFMSLLNFSPEDSLFKDMF